MILVIDIWNSNIEKYIHYIIINKDKIKKILINCLNDFDYRCIGGSYTFLDDCLTLCNTLNIPVILTSMYSEKFNLKLKDFSNYKNFIKIEWFTYWFNRTYIQMNSSNFYNSNLNLNLLNDTVNLDTTFDYTFITLNNLIKYHRAQFIDLLYKNDLFECGAISYRDAIRGVNLNEIPEGISNSEFLLTLNQEFYRFKYWKPKQLILDQPEKAMISNQLSNEIQHQSYLPQQYNQSFMQVVTESAIDTFIISEKTCVPLLFNKPFLVLSCKNFHKNLNELGFLLYDEIFDYAFDSSDSLLDRTEGIIKNLQKIKDIENKHELFEKIKNKLLYNRKIALKLIFEGVPDEVQNIVKDLIDSNIEIDLVSFVRKIKNLKNNKL